MANSIRLWMLSDYNVSMWVRQLKKEEKKRKYKVSSQENKFIMGVSPQKLSGAVGTGHCGCHSFPGALRAGANYGHMHMPLYLVFGRRGGRGMGLLLDLDKRVTRKSTRWRTTILVVENFNHFLIYYAPCHRTEDPHVFQPCLLWGFRTRIRWNILIHVIFWSWLFILPYVPFSHSSKIPITSR